jgi:hypothetical protein
VEQLVELHPPQELPPPPDGTWSSMLMSEQARETNLDMARPDRDLHFGQSVSSPDLDRGCSFSNLMWHLGQIYS